MGGNKDKTGHIDSAKLINTIKNDFELTIDIDHILSNSDVNN